ncbi:hypothetical protein C8J57DRAFT_1532598 [Mycena rebaudengoi]|nr:hypothetical protein C8J57DRAFT_1532598 [Mycena rebaudengoi]
MPYATRSRSVLGPVASSLRSALGSPALFASESSALIALSNSVPHIPRTLSPLHVSASQPTATSVFSASTPSLPPSIWDENLTWDLNLPFSRGAGGVSPLQIWGVDTEGAAVAFMEVIDDCGMMGDYTNLLVADQDFSLTGTGCAMGVGLETEVMFTAMQKCTTPASAYLLLHENRSSTLRPLYSSSLVPIPASHLVDLKQFGAICTLTMVCGLF